MAIRTFNSVGGFSVGEIPETIILANGDITTDFGTFTANVGAGNVKTDHLLYANGTPWNFTTPGGTDTQIQFNDGGSALGGSANFTFDKTTNLLTVSGTANVGNVNTTGTIVSEGNITAPYFIGDVVGNISGNIQVSGPNTGILFNDTGNANSIAGFTFNKANNFVSLDGNISAGNITTGLITGTLTAASAAQPNITSVGTLTSLSVTNTITGGNLSTGGNLTVSGQVISSLIPANHNTYDLGNLTYQWRNVHVADHIFIGTESSLYAVGNVIYTDALRTANNISAGTLTSRGDADLQGNVTVAGNLTVSGTTTYINVTNLAVNDPLISLGGSNGGGNAASYDGKDRGVWLRNYKSDGSMAINEFMGWDTSAGEFAFGSNVDVSGEVATFIEYGNIRANVVNANVTGTLLTAAQPQITSVGTLTNLTVSGIANVQTLANIANLYAGGLYYPTTDGTSGQYLKTDGSGHLTWGTVSTSSITNGTSNVNVQENSNVQIVVGGTSVANVTATGANITGTLNATGIATVGALRIGNSYVYSATVTTTTTAQTTLVSLSGTSFRVAEYFVKGEDIDGAKYSVATVSMVHNATDADWSTYGTVNLPSSASTGNLAVTYATSPSQIANLVVTPSSSNTTIWTIQYRLM